MHLTLRRRTTARCAGLPAEVTALEPRTMPSIAVQIDYSYDSSHFFDTQAKRDRLQMAVNMVAATLNDNLLAIQPAGGNSWSIGFTNPSTGQQTTIANPIIPANTLLLYVGARPLSTHTGEGGPGTSVSTGGDQNWQDLIGARGRTGALSATPTDFGPWGGSIAFDPGRLSVNQVEFITVAQHEFGHVLGIGTSPSWSAHVSGSVFTGPAAKAAHGGSGVPLDPLAVHWATGTKSDGVEAVMTPAYTNGQPITFTTLDYAGLKDIGWNPSTLINHAPILAVLPPRAVNEGGLLTFTAKATDSDTSANALTFALVAAPAGATIDRKTGTFSWTPPEVPGPAPGIYPVTVRVSDNGIPPLSDTESFTVTVNKVNAPPVLAPLSSRAMISGASLRFTAKATDTDLPTNSLTFKLVGAPTGATIDARTGVFSWKPTSAQSGRSFTLHVKVTDDGTPSLSDTKPLTISVLTRPLVVKVARRQVGDTLEAITVFFNGPMDQKSAGLSKSYAVLTSKGTNGPATVPVGVSPRYDPRTKSVTLTLSKLPKPVNANLVVQLTVRKTVTALNGVTLGKDQTFRVK